MKRAALAGFVCYGASLLCCLPNSTGEQPEAQVESVQLFGKRGIALDGLLALEIEKNTARLDRSHIKEAFSELTRYNSYILKGCTSSRHVDEALAKGLIVAESNGALRAHSKKGALGPGQLMASTAAELGLKIDRFEDWRYHPESISSAISYLDSLIERWDGDLVLGLAAYNAGPGRLAAMLRDASQASWSAFKEVLPAETVAFVIRVLSRAKLYSELGHEIESRPSFDEKLRNSINYQIKKGETLYGIAKVHGLKLHDILELNPQLKNPSTIKAGAKIRLPQKR